MSGYETNMEFGVHACLLVGSLKSTSLGLRSLVQPTRVLDAAMPLTGSLDPLAPA